jgi:hypothetical protein
MSDQLVAETSTSQHKHSQQTYIHAPLGFDPTISADDRKQTYALDCAVAGIDDRFCTNVKKKKINWGERKE